jgi:hypothetical protein
MGDNNDGDGSKLILASYSAVITERGTFNINDIIYKFSLYKDIHDANLK